MLKLHSWVATILACGFLSAANAQAPAQTQPQQTPPPATKLEAFKPAAGSVLTLGYDELGKAAGVSVDVREMRDPKSPAVRGLVVEVVESQYRTERSFVDADEIPELLRGFDALLEVKANPTQFKSFEVRYTTRGELQLTAFNSSNGSIMFAVQAGRTLKAQRVGLGTAEMQQLRQLFQSALLKLQAVGAART
jgi:hypothetical protein